MGKLRGNWSNVFWPLSHGSTSNRLSKPRFPVKSYPVMSPATILGVRDFFFFGGGANRQRENLGTMYCCPVKV